ncbi:LytR/AlgR family response regulator transcription factor [Pedobacter sp. MR2016-24]|uniref:LytR/AlgR family response regulator transcription factor n=1 Tax=Pedobacter sp. MR2016-24 TaxID=2994466 RepID=UPI002247626B|nr:LytTR family DNA-binding domain-containing protein [Pedobacter sp. MR2016-24]MCX2485810.1 LytTR family DNA-binding domain-containing protein [Pedobacter sp. MR2016-24]
MIRTLIIEDEPAIRKEIEYLVNQQTNFKLLGTAASVKDALRLIGDTQPDLVLMDIQLTDGTAFDILDQLNEVTFKIIFITAYNHFAIKAIKYGSLDYLLKPLDESELKAVMQSIVIKQDDDLYTQQQKLSIAASQNQPDESNLESRMILATQESLQVIQLKDIVYCQSDGGYTWFYLVSGEKILISKPLKFYDELLPEEWFLRPHQSYLVNIIYVDKYMKVGDLILKNKKEIPVSTRRKEYIMQRMMMIK